jgi:cell division protein FtsB
MSRIVALAGLVLLGLLYWKPIHAYVATKREVQQREREVAALRRQNRELERRIRTSASGEALVREARRLMLVKPGERLFVVKNINVWRAKH